MPSEQNQMNDLAERMRKHNEEMDRISRSKQEQRVK